MRPLKVTPPIRVLVAISGPVDLAELDVEAEWRRLSEALGDLERRGAITLERRDNTNLGELQRALRRSEYHVLHFVGHGGAVSPLARNGWGRFCMIIAPSDSCC